MIEILYYIAGGLIGFGIGLWWGNEFIVKNKTFNKKLSEIKSSTKVSQNDTNTSSK